MKSEQLGLHVVKQLNKLQKEFAFIIFLFLATEALGQMLFQTIALLAPQNMGLG